MPQRRRMSILLAATVRAAQILLLIGCRSKQISMNRRESSSWSVSFLRLNYDITAHFLHSFMEFHVKLFCQSDERFLNHKLFPRLFPILFVPLYNDNLSCSLTMKNIALYNYYKRLMNVSKVLYRINLGCF